MIFDVVTGNVLSARGYSEGSFENYNQYIKSMLISKGSSPMAYVLSNYRHPDLSGVRKCYNQHLFKFDPKVYSNSAIWMKKTVYTLGFNCDHLGLVFGRLENQIYAYSWHNGQSTISLLDTDGNSKW